jgi:hypothetical protein
MGSFLYSADGRAASLRKGQRHQRPRVGAKDEEEMPIISPSSLNLPAKAVNRARSAIRRSAGWADAARD